MEKDFDGWNIVKKKLDQSDRKFLFKQGEVWWCSVGINIGDESCGKGKTLRRPVLVLKKLSSRNFIGIPLSTKERVGTWFATVLINGGAQYFLLHQIRMFSTNRLQRRLTTLDKYDFLKVKEKLEFLLELSHNHQS